MTKSTIPEATPTDLLSWEVGRRKRLRVRGASMEPTLSPGDVVFVDTGAYANSLPADGDVVVATHPNEANIEIVKRVEFTDAGGAYLKSDNLAESDAADSRRFGLVPFELILGRVTATTNSKR